MYLPRPWLTTHGLTADDLRGPSLPASYPSLMEEVMETAESLDREGMSGIGLLPATTQTGIRTAARMYREIMNEVRARHYDNLTHRAFVPFRRKCLRVVFDGYERRKATLKAVPHAVAAVDFGF